LHVLSTPPAFVLSQDQTLHEEIHGQPSAPRSSGRSELFGQPLLRRAGAIRTCCLHRAVRLAPDRRHRRGSCKPGHSDHPGIAPAGSQCMLFSFQGSRTATPWPAVQPDLSTFAASAEAKALTRAHRAPRYVSVSVFGRSRRFLKRSDTAWRGVPPERSWENTTRTRAVKALRSGRSRARSDVFPL
jgi:hypothetical protein